VQYRSFGKLDWQPSALGFGAMRLPYLDGDAARIDEPAAMRMVRTAIDAGVNYIDTAWPYHKEQSEVFVGRCLQDGYRAQVKLATKMPSWLIKEQGDFDKHLAIQLDRLQTDRIDFYLLHALNKTHWPNLRDLKVFEWAEGALKDGRIGHLGFSFHDDLTLFKEIVDAYEWTFCQIMYNYMDVEFQAGREGLQYAASKGLAVVIMEPLRGGSLTVRAPEQIAAIWDEAAARRTQADWALQWLWNQPDVSLVLSGMSTIQHVEENLASAECSSVGILTHEELALFDRVSAAYRELSPIPCTDCKYCQPCSSGVDIPGLFSTYNNAQMYGDVQRYRQSYTQFMDAAKRADRCVACGECESVCPQQIKIIDWLKTAHAFLSETAV